MRTRSGIGAAAILTIGMGGSIATHGQGTDAKAADVIAQGRKALGGEKKLAGLQALSLKADYRRELSAGLGGGGGMIVMMGGPGGPGGPGGQATGEIEIDVAFPDKYYRQDTGRSGFSMTRIEGFEGDRPFIDVIANNPGMRVQIPRPTDDPARASAALRRNRADLARLMLGLVAGTQPGFAATFSYAGVAESPDGSAHMLDVNGPDDFKARLFIDTQTHLPLMLTYMEPEPRAIRMTAQGPGRGSSGTAAWTSSGAAAPSGQGGRPLPPDLTSDQRAELDKQIKEAEATPPKLVEQRLYFAEYRDVDGLLLPHRITRGNVEKPTEEWEVTSYKVNPAIKADRFKVGSE